MPPMQDDVDALVRHVLTDVTSRVFLAFAADDALLERYNDLCEEYGSARTNQEIGKAVKRALNVGTAEEREEILEMPDLRNFPQHYTRHQFR